MTLSTLIHPLAAHHFRFFDGNLAVQIANLAAMLCAMNGSRLFVKNKFEAGSKSFTLSNQLNIPVGIAIGNIPYAVLQVVLGYFAITNYRDRRFNALGFVLMGCLIAVFGISPQSLSHMPIPDLVGSFLAIYGAFCMKKKDFRSMAVMWILADIIFIYVAIREGLLGLLIQSIVFTYHGALRLHKSNTAAKTADIVSTELA